MKSSLVRNSVLLGAEDWSGAAALAADCCRFVADVEEEQIADEELSCYNCRLRRWAERGILCLATPG